MTYSDDTLKRILKSVKTIAVVGVSTNPVRPSYYVARYLGLKGYRVIPVNPASAGEMLFGQRVRASLSEIGEPVDMVDIFRRSEHVGPIVDEALAAFPRGRERGRRGEGRGAGRRGDPEPLPEDRVPAAVRGAADGRVRDGAHFLAPVR